MNEPAVKLVHMASVTVDQTRVHGKYIVQTLKEHRAACADSDWEELNCDWNEVNCPLCLSFRSLSKKAQQKLLGHVPYGIKWQVKAGQERELQKC